MVGHTHDDIDQMFSRFSTKLAADPHIVYSVPQFMNHLKSGFDPEPDVFFLREVNDWKTELDKFSQNVLGRHVMHGHLRPLQYQITMHESGQSQLKWKRSATQEDWFPRFAETARVHLLKKTVSFRDLKACPHKPVSVEDKTELIKVYQRTSDYIVHNKETTVAENDVYLQSFFTGDRSVLGPVDVGFIDLSPNKKWKSTLGDADDDVGPSASADRSIYEDEVLTEDEQLVYQGPLHSVNTKAVTHKDNLVDISLVEVGNLTLFRMPDDGFAIGKVLAKLESQKEIHIHWWGNERESSTVRTPQYPLNVKPPTGMTSVAKSKWRQIKYTDTVHYDTVLVEKIVLLTSKKVSAADFHKAQRRLEAAKAFQLQVRV